MIKRALMVIVGMIILTFTANAQKTTYTIAESSSTFLEPSPTIITTPLVADIKIIGDKISYVEPDALKVFPLTNIQQLPQLRSMVVARATRAHNADLLVGVSFDMQTTEKGELVVTVTGYPAKYNNFRNASYEEVRAVYLAKLATKDDVQTILNGDSPLIIQQK